MIFTVRSLPFLCLERMRSGKTTTVHPVVIDLNYRYPAGLDAATAAVKSGDVEQAKSKSRQRAHEIAGDRYAQYVFAWLTAASIRRVVQLDRGNPPAAIFRIWPDFETHALINKSAQTIKATAARTSFAATGKGIVWAVLDSGIDAKHPHFKKYRNLDLESPIEHRDFTPRRQVSPDRRVRARHTRGRHPRGLRQHQPGLLRSRLPGGYATKWARQRTTKCR